MKRPSDQAKLLFLGLLKTVSALATEPRGAVTAASSSWHMNAAWRRGVMTTTSTMLSSTTTTTTTVATPSLTSTSWKTPQDRTVGSSSSSSSSNGNNNNHNMPTTFPPLTLRLAKRTDVPSMQRCNLATLPENYNGAFYVQHMRDWPELALVVVVEEEEEEPETSKSRRSSSSSPRDFIGSNSGLSFSPFPTNTHLQQQNPPPLVVAYVLGKVEERTVERSVVEDADDDIENGWLHRRLSSASQQQQQTIYETQHIGHITSLAVLQDYRRKGLAQALMEQLHVQLQRHYGTASQVGLHVRQSNKAATALYHGFGYAVTECIPQYYQDGEDAYYMMKDLEQQRHGHANGAMSSAATRGGGGGLFGQYWRQRQRAQATLGAAEEEKHDDPWAMPRSVGRQPREEESEEQLMTGTF